MGYIFETEIEAIKNAVRASTIGEEDAIALKEILSAGVHSAIKAYFKAEVEKLLKQERGLEYRSKKFAYSHPSVVSLQRQIDLLLLQHYEFSHAEFESLLDESVHFQFNYLCRPQWTLMNFILGNNRKVSVSDVESKLEYCVDYEYLPTLIKRFCVDKGLAEITYEEFRDLIAKIDSEVVGRHSSFELARMTRALFTFVDEGKILPHNQYDQPTLPINAAIVFFEDKSLDEVKSRLEYERDVNKVDHLSVAELASLIEKARTRNEEAGIPVVSFSSAEEPIAPLPSESQPLSFVREQNPTVEQRQDSAAVTPQVPPPSSQAEPEFEFDPSAVVLKKDVNALFTPSDRKRFVKNIFHKDADAFEAALEELKTIVAWSEASLFLDALFVANDIDPFSKEAVEFTDHIYARYFPSHR